ncbi:T6SS effector BTH_I2691 family protein [Budvicia diplopodorum]|uniref:T6SS effector BTH_I2691 family protein n=1 Tax=Budvicia diplopodorum TaxID=1119056 RepID=UPI00135ABD3F|nr:T6SS effector BTH_I2691 family protein [Budvicia diplopodorum]
MGALKEEKSCGCIEHDDSMSIPLMPVRAAISPLGAKTPVLPKNFQVLAEASGEIAYTSRILNKGFLYVYDEKDKIWSEYLINEGGYYFPLKKDALVSDEMLSAKTFNCSFNPTHEGMASFITVKAHKDFVTRLAWSPVRWTDKVWTMYQDAENRNKFMQVFNSGVWYDYVMSKQEEPSNVPNCIGMRSLATVVAEYAESAQSNTEKFNRFCLTNFFSKPPKLINYIHSAADKVLFHGGAIFNVQDPTGVTTDLASLRRVALDDRLFENQEFKDGLFLVGAITQLEVNIREKAAKEFSDDHYNLGRPAQSMGSIGQDLELYGKNDDQREDIEEKRDEERSQLAKEISLAEDEAWVQYSKRIESGKGSKKALFEETYAAEYKKIGENIIKPIDDMHAKITASNIFSEQFEGHFDGENPKHSVVYVKLFSSCIIGTQESPTCAAVYKQWMDDDTDKYNPLNRALLFNNAALIKDIDQAVKNKVGYDKIPWADYFGQLKAFIDVAEKALGNNVDYKEISQLNDALLKIIASPFSETLQQNSTLINKISKTIIGAGVSQYRAFIPINVTGKQKAFIAEIVRIATGINSSDHITDKQVRDILQRLAIKGVKVAGKDKKIKRYFIALDEKSLDRIEEIIKKGIPWEEYRDLTRDTAARMQRTNAKVQGAHLSVRGFVVVLQAAQVLQFINDKNEWSRNGRPETVFAGLSLAALAGGAIELGADLAYAYRVLSSIEKEKMLKLSAAGKKLGMAAGIGLAIYDGFRAVEEFQADNMKLFGLYAASAALGGLAVLASSTTVMGIVSGWVGVSLGFWPALVIIGIALFVSYLIDEIKGDDIEKWLMRTRWGIPSDTTVIKFKDGAAEQKQYRILMGLEKDEEKEKKDKEFNDAIYEGFQQGVYL